MEEKKTLYTLEEAKQVFADRECYNSGHDWDLIVSGAGDIIQIACRCCGRRWKMEEI